MLKINMDVIKCKKANTSARLMGFQISRNFEKMRIFEKISKNIEISNFIEEKDKKYMRWRGTLRVLRAETWLTVYRTIAIFRAGTSLTDHRSLPYGNNS